MTDWKPLTLPTAPPKKTGPSRVTCWYIPVLRRDQERRRARKRRLKRDEMLCGRPVVAIYTHVLDLAADRDALPIMCACRKHDNVMQLRIRTRDPADRALAGLIRREVATSIVVEKVVDR
jgi:hypothetical protein